MAEVRSHEGSFSSEDVSEHISLTVKSTPFTPAHDIVRPSAFPLIDLKESLVNTLKPQMLDHRWPRGSGRAP